MSHTSNVPISLINQLTAKGLTVSQASSKAVEVAIEVLNTKDNQELLNLTHAMCDEMIRSTEKRLDEMDQLYKELSDKVKSVSDTILAIKSATEEYGDISDQKAKDAISFYAALLAVGEKYTGADVVGAGYMVYAFLGGQAARINYSYEPNDDARRKAVMRL